MRAVVGVTGARPRTVVTDDIGRHPLADLAFVQRIGEWLQVRMSVHVDEAGGEDASACVNGAAGVAALQFADRHNGIALGG